MLTLQPILLQPEQGYSANTFMAIIAVGPGFLVAQMHTHNGFGNTRRNIRYAGAETNAWHQDRYGCLTEATEGPCLNWHIETGYPARGGQ